MYHTAAWHVLKKKLKSFHSRLHIGQGLSETGIKNRIIRPAMYGDVEGESQRFETLRFLCLAHALPALCCEHTKLQELGPQRPENIYETAYSSRTLMVWCAIFRTEVTGPYTLQTVLLEETYTKGYYNKYCPFRELTNYPSEMTFQARGSSPPYTSAARKPFERKAFKHGNGET